jgi:hypothetical protein
MRYLRKYNESNTDDVIQTIKDILLPISDMGYDISIIEDKDISFYPNFLLARSLGLRYFPQFVIRVVSWGDQSLLITDEVKEEFMRMKDYLQSEGYNSIEVLYHLATPGSNTSRDIKEFDNFMKYEPWQKVKIQNLLFVAK